jgi:hypothetical protein
MAQCALVVVVSFGVLFGAGQRTADGRGQQQPTPGRSPSTLLASFNAGELTVSVTRLGSGDIDVLLQNGRGCLDKDRAQVEAAGGKCARPLEQLNTNVWVLIRGGNASILRSKTQPGDHAICNASSNLIIPGFERAIRRPDDFPVKQPCYEIQHLIFQGIPDSDMAGIVVSVDGKLYVDEIGARLAPK